MYIEVKSKNGTEVLAAVDLLRHASIKLRIVEIRRTDDGTWVAALAANRRGHREDGLVYVIIAEASSVDVACDGEIYVGDCIIMDDGGVLHVDEDGNAELVVTGDDETDAHKDAVAAMRICSDRASRIADLIERRRSK